MQGCRAASYMHLMFEAHQIIFANGAPGESVYPGQNAFAAPPQAARREVMILFPGLDPHMTQGSYGATARGLPPGAHCLPICAICPTHHTDSADCRPCGHRNDRRAAVRQRKMAERQSKMCSKKW